jgi:putative tricarboxylic transport membrane protein
MARRLLRSIPRDGWAGLALIAGGLFFLAHLLRAPAEGVTEFVSATTLPTALAAFLAGLGAVLLAAAWRTRSRAVPPTSDGSVRTDSGGKIRVLLLVAGTAAYIWLLPVLGYLACTMAYIGGIALLFGNRRPISVALLMLLIPLALMLFFEKFMIIPLPSASLFG